MVHGQRAMFHFDNFHAMKSMLRKKEMNGSERTEIKRLMNHHKMMYKRLSGYVPHVER